MHYHAAQRVLAESSGFVILVMEILLELPMKGIVIGSTFLRYNCERFKWIIRNFGTRHNCTVFVDLFDDLLHVLQ
jgi:hypothetical protein